MRRCQVMQVLYILTVRLLEAIKSLLPNDLENLLFSTRQKCLNATNNLTKRRHHHTIRKQQNFEDWKHPWKLTQNNYKISNTLHYFCIRWLACIWAIEHWYVFLHETHTYKTSCSGIIVVFFLHTHTSYYRVIQSIQTQWKTVHSTHKRSIIQYSVVLQKWSQNSWVSETLLSSSVTGLFIFPRRTSSFHIFTLMKFIIDCIF